MICKVTLAAVHWKFTLICSGFAQGEIGIRAGENVLISLFTVQIVSHASGHAGSSLVPAIRFQAEFC